MAKRRPHRFVWDSLGLSSPEVDRESASPSAARNGVQGDADAAADYAGPNGDENVKDEPARLAADESGAGEEQSWSERFASPEELWTAFRNEQKVRGRLANELGKARALIEELEEQVEAFEQIVFAQIELGKSRAVLGAGGKRIPAAGLEALLAGAGVRFESPDGLQEERPSSLAGDGAPQLPDSPEAA
jgi:hypothetical protein